MDKSRRRHSDAVALKHRMERCLADLVKFSGTMCRAVAVKHANSNDLLTGAGAKVYGGRWNPPGIFCAVYGTLDPYAALAETIGAYRQYGIAFEQRLPLVLIGIAVDLQSVLDLTDGKLRQRLGVSEGRMLESDWQTTQTKGGEGLTQTIGRLAWEAKVEAILVPSARLKNEKNLVIFPDRLWKASHMEIVNRHVLPESRL